MSARHVGWNRNPAGGVGGGPALEQPPEAGARRAAVSKEMTLNAVVKRFPELLHVLHAFQIDMPWFGSDTLEELAWHRGLPVEDVLGELNRSIERLEEHRR